MRRETDVSTTHERLGSALLTLAFSVSAVGALLYFLGKSRVQSMQVMLGMPAGIIDSSPTDSAAAGVDVVLPFFAIGAVILLFGVAAYRVVVVPALAKPRHHRAHKIVRSTLATLTDLAWVGLGIVAIGLFVQEITNVRFGLALPVMLTVSTGGLACRWVSPRQRADRSGKLLFSLSISLTVAGLLWSGALYGGIVGQRFAEHYAANAAELAEVTVVSRDDLRLTGHGATSETLAHEQDTDYRYCYQSLRYLMKNDKFYIFVGVDWRVGDDLFYVLTTSDIRINTRRAGDGPSMCSEQ